MAENNVTAQGSAPWPEPDSGQTSGQLSQVKPWAAVALLLTAVILVIYGYQAFNYWSSWSKTGSLTTRTDTLTRILSREEPSLEAMAGQLESSERKLEQLRQAFDYESVDSMISMLSTTASSVGVGLASISVSDPALDEIDGIRYQIQPITVTVLGSPPGIFSFLESFSEPAPSAVVSSFQLGGLDSDAVAKLSIQFYLSPQLILDGELAEGAK